MVASNLHQVAERGATGVHGLFDILQRQPCLVRRALGNIGLHLLSVFALEADCRLIGPGNYPYQHDESPHEAEGIMG